MNAIVRGFEHFITIDWSGAQGEQHKAITMAITHRDGGPPVLVERQKGWSRSEVLQILRSELPDNSLVGLDLGIALPFLDKGSYFPGWEKTPTNAKGLWALIDSICEGDPHMAANSFVNHPQASEYFRRHGGREGKHFGGGRGRLRTTERVQAEMGCKPYSNFNLVGAAQVGKSSLTGMRVLNRLRGVIPVWPIDPLPKNGCVIVEIYTALAAMAAGRTASRSKIRSYEELDAALLVLGCPPLLRCGEVDDHATDALISAAWLRRAALEESLWSPKGLTRQIAQTEGWTFGAA